MNFKTPSALGLSLVLGITLDVAAQSMSVSSGGASVTASIAGKTATAELKAPDFSTAVLVVEPCNVWGFPRSINVHGDVLVQGGPGVLAIPVEGKMASAPGAFYSWVGRQLNDARQIVAASGSGRSSWLYQFDGESMTGMSKNYAIQGINNKGWMIGSDVSRLSDEEFQKHGLTFGNWVLEMDGMRRPLGMEPGGFIYGLNDEGEVVGSAYFIDKDGNEWFSGVHFDKHQRRVVLDGYGEFEEAHQVNAHGQIIGITEVPRRIDPEWPMLPVLWDGPDGAMKILPYDPKDKYGWPYGINRFGQIVGEIDTGPALWINGKLFDFSRKLVNPHNVRLWWFQDINDKGEILAGTSSGVAKVRPVWPRMAVDANRDGLVTLSTEDDSDKTRPDHPFCFWINDDDDAGSIATCDIPGSSTPDGQKTKVQGVRDLIDYFPVFLDIKQLLGVLPPGTNSIAYKLKQAEDAVRFVYTDLKREDAFKYLTDNATGTALKDADAHWATATGYELDATWLGQVKDGDKGVILITGRNPTDKPLRLVVEKAGAEIAEVSLNIKISPVEDMFRHLNLREGADAAAGLVGDRRDCGKPTRLDNPVGLPDTSANQPWFIFLVGSNVGGQSGRGWEAETFKRLYWSRGDDGKFAKTRFLGVSWFGDPYANGSDGVYDYHLAVRNAFATAPALASRVNSLPGNGSKTIGGHSLACGVIAAALSDHGMNVNHAALVDAALAREVFDGRAGSGDQLSAEESGMTPAVWRNYAPRLQSPSWHERFAGASGDNRQALTWRNRFIGAVPKIHSFYSSTEDVLGSYGGEVPSTALGAAAVVIMDGAAFTAYVWVYQEKAKGNRQDYWMIGIGSFHAGSTYIGWGMNLKDPLLSGDPPHWKWVNSPDYIGRMIKTSAEIGNVSDGVLRRHPVFEPGWGVVRNQEQQEITVSNVSPVDNAPSWIYDLYGATSGSTQAGAKTSANHAQLLAEAIPAQSWAVGSHQLNSSTLPITKQHNMPAEYAGPGWPRSLINGVREWRHSDMREVPYLHQSRFWEALVSISQQP